MSESFDHRDDFERLFDQNFLRWFHLQGKPALLEIVKVTREELTLADGFKIGVMVFIIATQMRISILHKIIKAKQ